MTLDSEAWKGPYVGWLLVNIHWKLLCSASKRRSLARVELWFKSTNQQYSAPFNAQKLDFVMTCMVRPCGPYVGWLYWLTYTESCSVQPAKGSLARVGVGIQVNQSTVPPLMHKSWISWMTLDSEAWKGPYVAGCYWLTYTESCSVQPAKGGSLARVELWIQVNQSTVQGLPFNAIKVDSDTLDSEVEVRNVILLLVNIHWKLLCSARSLARGVVIQVNQSTVQGYPLMHKSWILWPWTWGIPWKGPYVAGCYWLTYTESCSVQPAKGGVTEWSCGGFKSTNQQYR
jgi:hypothetical protein